MLLILEGVKVPAKRFSLAAAAGFGPSPFNRSPHLLVEAAIPLVIPAGYGGLSRRRTRRQWPRTRLSARACLLARRSRTSTLVRAAILRTAPAANPAVLEAKALFRVNPDASLTLNPDLLPLPDCSATAILACPPDLVVTTSENFDPVRVDYPLPLVPACLGLQCDPPPGSVFPSASPQSSAR